MTSSHNSRGKTHTERLTRRLAGAPGYAFCSWMRFRPQVDASVSRSTTSLSLPGLGCIRTGFWPECIDLWFFNTLEVFRGARARHDFNQLWMYLTCRRGSLVSGSRWIRFPSRHCDSAPELGFQLCYVRGIHRGPSPGRGPP